MIKTNNIDGYEELEKLDKTVAIFGAGRYGTTWCYDILKSAGIEIVGYFDNAVYVGKKIKELEVLPLEYLYDNADKIIVFIAMSNKYQEVIAKQLETHEVFQYVNADIIFLQKIINSVNLCEDEKIKQRYSSVVDDEQYLKRQFEYSVGYKLDLVYPKTFNEKLQWLKLHEENDYTLYVDKYSAKDIVRNKIGDEYVIPTLGIWDKVDDIEFDCLPEKFVIKCTHDSGSTIIVHDKKNIDKLNIKEKIDYAMQVQFFWTARETPYRTIHPRIIAEPLIEESEKIIDYKILCFNGEPKILFTCSERDKKGNLKVTFFDLNWNRLAFERHYSSSKNKIKRPEHLEKMIQLARKLSEGIVFVRIDFYEVNGHIYFGEYTFYPGAGFEEFSPVEWDYRLGEWIHLPEKRRLK